MKRGRPEGTPGKEVRRAGVSAAPAAPASRRLAWLLGLLLTAGAAFLVTGQWREGLLRESARYRAMVAEREALRARQDADQARLAALGQHVREQPEDPEARLELAQLRWRREGPGAAIPVLAGAPNPDSDVRLTRMLAECYRLAGREDLALDLLDRAIRRLPEDGDLRADRALLYSLLAWHADAETEIRAARARGAGELFLARTTLARAKGDLAAARTILDAARREHPDDPEVIRQLAAVAEAGGQYEEAARLLNSLPEPTPDDRTSLAAAYLRQPDRAGEALELLDRARSTHPPSPTTRLLRARCLRKLGRPAEARAELEALRAQVPVFGSAFELAELYRREGRTAEAAQLLAEHRTEQERRTALRHAADRLMREPRSAAAHQEVGRLCLERGQYGRAIVELERALALDPRSPGGGALLAHARQRADNPGRAADAG